MKILIVIGWAVLIILTAIIGAVVGAFVGIFLGPAKLFQLTAGESNQTTDTI